MEEKISRRPHHLDLMNRGTGSVTGIQDVVAFDENQIVLDTDMGLLTVKGKGLHVSRLTLEKGEGHRGNGGQPGLFLQRDLQEAGRISLCPSV